MALNANQYRRYFIDIIQESWLIKIGLIGILFVLIGAIRQVGASAALVAIYGFGFIVIGFGGYVLLVLYKKVTWERQTVEL